MLKSRYTKSNNAERFNSVHSHLKLRFGKDMDIIRMIRRTKTWPSVNSVVQ